METLRWCYFIIRIWIMGFKIGIYNVLYDFKDMIFESIMKDTESLTKYAEEKL